ncbi:MAG TPA: group II intron reverse transcriptase/maturase [Planctomycetota bacterium]|nr:group II intron reverse transcriptase/maturase [Planctomycetota bacterium]
MQKSLQEKAKAEPTYRFYSLWDKVCREDVLRQAWRLCRSNGGAPGSDGATFEAIETGGVELWLGNLQEELRTGMYRPLPLLRVWIPKRSGGERPLGIPAIRDRVAQAAVVLVIGPIFEADLRSQQYGFRPGLDAKMAVRRAYFHIAEDGRTEIVDADLTDYFNTIPHGPLMRCVSRRVADGQVLAVVKRWLEAPVVERCGSHVRRTAEARSKHRGTPQGGVISPLLANLYFRRFILGWERSGAATRTQSAIVNYADDFVLCCRPGNGAAALEAMRSLMSRIGLQVNERKTHLVRLPEERFDFLGYTIGRFYGRAGRPYLGTSPSRKSISHALRQVHAETSRRWVSQTIESRIERINEILRGWCGYFNQGPVIRIYMRLERYTRWRLRRWLRKKHKGLGHGSRVTSYEYLHETLGLYRPFTELRSRPRAKS